MRAAWLWFTALWVIGSVACQAPPAAPLRVGVNAWMGYDPLVLAQEQRLFDREQLRILEMMSASDSQEALADGLIDGAALTLDEFLRLSEARVPCKIVAALDSSHGDDAVLASKNIHSPTELRGKRIAVESSAAAQFILARMLETGGLRPADVTQIVAEPPQHLGLITRGQVDAVVTYEPYKSQLVNAGQHVVFDSRQMPGEIIDVLVMSQQALRNRRPQVVEAVRAWERGRAVLAAHPEVAGKLLGPSFGLTAQDYVQANSAVSLYSVRESVALLQGAMPALASHGAPVAKALVRLGYLQRLPSWPALVDASIAAEAARQPEAEH